MNILIVSSSAPFGKGESFVISELNAIAQAGHSVTLFPAIIRRGTPNAFELAEGVQLLARKSLSIQIFICFLKFAVCRPGVLIKIISWVRDRSPVNTLKNLVVLPKAIWLGDRLRAHPVDHIHAHWLSTPSTVAMVAGWLANIPWSASAHRGDIVMDNLLRAKISRAEFVRFISKSGTSLARERADLDADKTRLLHLGVEVPEAPDMQGMSQRSDKNQVQVLCPANLIPVKGHSFLFQALARMKYRDRIALRVAGEGELKQPLQQLVSDLGLEQQVTFEGHVPHSNLLDLYRSHTVDLVVLPSQDLGDGVHEGIPVSLMEAMACGVPVISTETGGIPELLRDSNGQMFGGLVNATDLDAFARVLDDYVDSEELRRDMGIAGYRRVYEEFNQTKIVAELTKLMSRNDAASSNSSAASTN